MTVEEYETLTGTTVPSADTTRVEAVIRKATTKLEFLLGYSLSQQKTWTELGKVQYDGLVPFPSLPVSDEVIDNLTPPDPVTGEIQLFNFDELDKHLRINPATEIYRAKVVLPINEDEFITIYDLENGLPYLNSAGLVVAITKYNNWFTWSWWNSLLWGEKSNLMLAVDASYADLSNVDAYPEIAYLLADMVTYYKDPDYSLMGNIRSESIDSHSYSRAPTGSNPDSAAPEGQASSRNLIQKYAGPGGFRKRVT